MNVAFVLLHVEGVVYNYGLNYIISMGNHTNMYDSECEYVYDLMQFWQGILFHVSTADWLKK